MDNRCYAMTESGRLTPLGRSSGQTSGEVVAALVSLVSVWSGNWCYLCEGVERVEKGEIVEIPNTDAVLMHVSENRVGWEKRQGEYPTLSAIFCFGPLSLMVWRWRRRGRRLRQFEPR